MATADLIQERYVVGQSVIRSLEDLFRYTDTSLVVGTGTILSVQVYTGTVSSLVAGYGFADVVDGLGKTQADTLTGVSVILAAENFNRLDTAIVSGIAVPVTTFELHTGNESPLVIGVGTPSFTQISTLLDANTNVGQGVASVVEVRVFAQVDTVSGTADITYKGRHIYPDELPIVTVASVITGVNKLDTVDWFIANGTATASSIEIFGGEISPVFVGVAIPGTTSTELDTVVGIAVPIGSEHYNFRDAATVAGFAVITADISPAVDEATVTGVASLRVSESLDFNEFPVAIGTAVPFTTFDYPTHNEAGTVVGVSDTSTTVEDAGFVQVGTVTGTAVVIGVYLAAGYDVSLYEVNLYGEPTGFDADIVTGTNVISIVELYP